MRRLIMMAVVVVSLCVCGGKARGVDFRDFALFREHRGLLNTSALGQTVDKKVRKLNRPKLGAFGIGGLNAFTLMGLSYPFNTYHNTTTYYHPFFSDSWIGVEAAGKAVDFPLETIRYVRGTSVAVTLEQNDTIAMATVNFSPPESGAFVRIVVLKALADVRDIYLFADVYGDKETRGNEIIQVRDEGRRLRTMHVGSLDGKAIEKDGRLGVRLESLKKGEEKVFYFYYWIQNRNEDGTKLLKHLETDREKLVDATMQWWKGYLAGTTRLETPDARLDDLIEQMKIALKIQRNASGAQVPVVKYADRSHDRENLRIEQFYLMAGMPGDAENMMLYGYKAALKSGVIHNSMEADMDLSGPTREPDWDKIPMDNFESTYFVAERPSWTVLAYYWIYRETGDLSFVKKVYPYLRRNMTAQEIEPNGLMPFHGDEMYQISFPSFVSGVLLKDMYSLESSLAFVAASRGFEEIAAKLGHAEDARWCRAARGRVEAAIYKYYWGGNGWFYPALLKKDEKPVEGMFPLVGLELSWVGYPFDEEKMRSNFLAMYNTVGQKDGSIKMGGRAPMYHGQLQGLLLYDMKYFRHPDAEKTFHLVIDKVADPAGQFSEAQKNDHTHVSFSVDQGGKGKEDARRFGPWEGGTVAASLMYYLTGMDVDAPRKLVRLVPEMPSGWKQWKLVDGRIGGNRFDLTAKDENGKLIYRFVNKGQNALKVGLSLPMREKTPGAVRVDGRPATQKEFNFRDAADGKVVDVAERLVKKQLIVEIAYR